MSLLLVCCKRRHSEEEQDGLVAWPDMPPSTPLRSGLRDLQADAALPPESAGEEQCTSLVKQKRP